MVDATHIRFQASDRSYFSIIKKDIHQQAGNAGFDPKKIGDIDLVVSEMTSNLHKYAKGGEILAGLFEDADNTCIEIISIDSGPGMIDPAKMMVDGTSSSKTMGMGLGSIKRLSDVFDIYSLKDWGTIVLSRIYKKPYKNRLIDGFKLEVRPLVITMPGQQKCGDGTFYKWTDSYLKMLVADGLGHGPEANHAVNEAVNAFKISPYHTPSEIIRDIHQSSRKTRGLVGTVVVFDFKTQRWSIAGVGNIATRMSNFFEFKNSMSYNGIIGNNIPNTISNMESSLSDFHQVTLCSDGIKSRWELSKLAGINRCDLSIQAAAIYKDFGRQTDDMSVVIAKILKR